MGWDQLATLAQLVTGAATLAVAVLLVGQLRQQHRDSEREILYTANRDMTDIFGRTIDPHFGPIWHKGGKDFDSLSVEEEEQYRVLCYAFMSTQSVNFRAGHEGLDRGIDSRVRAQSIGFWTISPGMATYYERFGRSHTFDPELKALLDSAFLELFGREVDTSWHFGMKQVAS